MTPVSGRFTSSLISQIQAYANRPQKAITLEEMIKTATAPNDDTRLANAQFLYKELPIRLAKRTKELDNLPYGLGLTEPVLKVKSWYSKSFHHILSSREPQNAEDNRQFTELLKEVLGRHSNVVPTMAQGVLQIKSQNTGIDACPFLQDFLDRFYMSRIGIRMLIAQHIAMSDSRLDYAGTIALSLNPVDVAHQAISDASRTCEKNYGVAPDVDVYGHGRGDVMRIGFVPSHLHHMLHEVLKNSMRAVVEFHGQDNYELPPIDIVFANGEEDWSIKVSDQGGGIRRAEMERVWSYLHSTAASPTDFFSTDHNNPFNAPMAGLGYGLPLSRLFARYFGGDLQVVSMEGHGTDVYLYLHKLTGFNLFLD